MFGRKFGPERILPLYAATLGISALGLLASNGFVFAGVEFAGMPLALAKALTAVAVLVLNYVLRVMTVYRAR